MENKLTTAENFAAGQVLTEWPDDMTYDELLDAIKDEHEDVIVWQQFEDELTDDIIETIENMRITFIHTVARMTADLREAIKIGSPSIINEELGKLEQQLGA